MEPYIDHLLKEVPKEYLIALGLLLVILIVQMYYYFRYYNKIIRYNKKIQSNNVQGNNKDIPVSVIICAQNEAENLEKFLPSVLEQRYSKYEVIVVNDGSTDQSSELLERLDKQYSHLYHTFLPMDAKYISRKKMCLTVGIKAAKYDHLVLLDADCEPVGKDWLSGMMLNYEGDTGIVLGYSKTAGENNLLGKIIRYDSITSAMRHFGFALNGRAYKGTSKNLSYKKDLFFKNKGFSSNLNLELGDDDLFIQEIATENNVKVEFRPSTHTISHREETLKSFLYQKELSLKTLSNYKKSIQTSISIENISRFLFYITFTVLLVFYLVKQEWILAGATAILFLFRYITQVNIIRKSAAILEEKPFFFLIPILDILLPLISLYTLTFGKIGNKSNNIWG